MALSSLPNEILVHISKNLEKNSDKLQLILTCRRFYAALVIDLYKAIYLGPSPKTNRISSLVRTFLRSPNLSRAVQKIELCNWKNATLPAAAAYLPSDEKDSLVNFVSCQSHSEDAKRFWMQDLETGVCDAWVGLLMTQIAPNLQQLLISFPRETTYIPGVLLRTARTKESFDADEIPPFSQLHHVSIENHDGPIPLCADIRPFLCFPAMKSLSAVGMAGWIKRAWPPLSTCPSTVRFLKIKGIHCKQLAGIIRSCQEVKSVCFITEIIDNDSWDSGPHIIYDSLIGMETSLENLWLDFGDLSARTSRRQLGSFASFSSLKRLRISVKLIRLIDVEVEQNVVPWKDLLPRQLECLHLSDCLLEFPPRFPRELLALVLHSTHLRELDVEFPSSLRAMKRNRGFSMNTGFAREIRTLSVTCRAKSVLFRMHDSAWRSYIDPMNMVWDDLRLDKFHTPSRFPRSMG